MIMGNVVPIQQQKDTMRQDWRPNKMIWITFRKEGMHRYPAAATV